MREKEFDFDYDIVFDHTYQLWFEKMEVKGIDKDQLILDYLNQFTGMSLDLSRKKIKRKIDHIKSCGLVLAWDVFDDLPEYTTNKAHRASAEFEDRIIRERNLVIEELEEARNNLDFHSGSIAKKEWRGGVAQVAEVFWHLNDAMYYGMTPDELTTFIMDIHSNEFNRQSIYDVISKSRFPKNNAVISLKPNSKRK